MANRSSVVILLLVLLCAGCGGGGGGGSTPSPPKPPQPPWSLRIYESEHRNQLVCQGTVSTTEQGRYQITLQGKPDSIFRRQDVRVDGQRIALPVGDEGRKTIFSRRDFERGMREIKAGKETEIRAVDSGLIYVIHP